MKHITLLNGIKTLGTIVFLVVAIAVGVQHSEKTHASGSDNVSGFLWSDAPDANDEAKGSCIGQPHCGRGFGWISLNNVDTATSVGYGVNLNQQTGLFTGYGWSEHAGWLQFDPSGPYPSGPGTTGSSAKVDPSCLSSGAAQLCPVSGWVRFIGGATPPFGGADDGWDGWVSLKGTGYGVTLNSSTGAMYGLAWGDVNAGWIDFKDAKVTLTPPPVNNLTCYDANNVAYTYAMNGPVPPQCTQLSCTTATGQVVYYPFGGTFPSQCTSTPPPPWNTCTTSQGIVYIYPAGGVMPQACSQPTDLCSLIPGDQTGSGPWQGSGGVWYGLSNGVCTMDLCIDTSDVGTSGFQAVVPFTYNGSTYVIDGSDGVCKKQTAVVGCTDPADCPTKPINPIYKEN